MIATKFDFSYYCYRVYVVSWDLVMSNKLVIVITSIWSFACYYIWAPTTNTRILTINKAGLLTQTNILTILN